MNTEKIKKFLKQINKVLIEGLKAIIGLYILYMIFWILFK